MCGIFFSSIRYLLATGCLASSIWKSISAIKTSRQAFADQIDAVNAVVDLFDGQPLNKPD